MADGHVQRQILRQRLLTENFRGRFLVWWASLVPLFQTDNPIHSRILYRLPFPTPWLFFLGHQKFGGMVCWQLIGVVVGGSRAFWMVFRLFALITDTQDSKQCKGKDIMVWCMVVWWWWYHTTIPYRCQSNVTGMIWYGTIPWYLACVCLTLYINMFVERARVSDLVGCEGNQAFQFPCLYHTIFVPK